MELSDYFRDTEPEEWNLIGFYKHRQREPDFTRVFQKEAFKLRKSLDYLLENGTTIAKARADRLIKSLKASVKHSFCRALKR
ncbi:hypothetical protein BC938DRAFT_473842 [Jimgerdemannia flammicorona]|uniref:Uncharacterized protein n=1 Tax=Jimgerdemannia flammicorona TaxID=994334 RepID=A0A433QT08_9FUNG|nr:hypothetical protein BC938DRAFT_473842 [Jimgerdemannia flammicorona]